MNGTSVLDRIHRIIYKHSKLVSLSSLIVIKTFILKKCCGGYYSNHCRLRMVKKKNHKFNTSYPRCSIVWIFDVLSFSELVMEFYISHVEDVFYNSVFQITKWSMNDPNNCNVKYVREVEGQYHLNGLPYFHEWILINKSSWWGKKLYQWHILLRRVLLGMKVRIYFFI